MSEHAFVPGPKRIRLRHQRRILRSVRPDRIESTIDSSSMTFIQQLVAMGLAGTKTKISTSLFYDEVGNLARRNPQSTLGITGKYLLHALDKGSITDCATEVYGIEISQTSVSIDPELTTIAIQEAIDTLVDYSRKGASIIFASSRPNSTLELFSQLAKMAHDNGANIIDSSSDTSASVIDGRRDRYFTWFSHVGVMSDGQSLLASNDSQSADDLFFFLPRADLVVADHVFSAQALTSGYPTIAFCGLESLAVAVASTNEKSCLSVPISLSMPSSNYAIIANYAKTQFDRQ